MSAAIRRGRRAEQRLEKNPRYYALNAHPNFREFQRAYVDDAGREYQFAPAAAELREDDTLTRLYVRLPRPAVPWFGPDVRDTQLALYDIVTGKHAHTITIHSVYRMAPRHRTGHVHVYN